MNFGKFLFILLVNHQRQKKFQMKSLSVTLYISRISRTSRINVLCCAQKVLNIYLNVLLFCCNIIIIIIDEEFADQPTLIGIVQDLNEGDNTSLGECILFLFLTVSCYVFCCLQLVEGSPIQSMSEPLLSQVKTGKLTRKL